MEFENLPVNSYLYSKELSISLYDVFVKAFKSKDNGNIYIDLDSLAKISGATTSEVDTFTTNRVTELGITEDEYLYSHTDAEGSYRLAKLTESGKFLLYLLDNSFTEAEKHLEYLSNKGIKGEYS
jgi:hypothetical protein